MSSFSFSLEKISTRSIPLRAKRKLRVLLQGRARCFELALSLTEGKTGLEIGGPTDIFQGWRKPSMTYGLIKPLPIYDRIGSLDNCNFSSKTIWSTHEDTFRFSPRRPPGKTIIAEGSSLSSIGDATYDFILSSHNLEHFANPVKALEEWKRVTRPGGALILSIPHYRKTFDHRRPTTPGEHFFEDYRRNVGEDDLTHVPEVLRFHDVEMDGTLTTHTFEELRARSLDNLSNRCLHHHVFDESNAGELLERVGLQILAMECALPYHLLVLSRWKE